MAANIPLPPLNGTINLPPEPQNPPVASDIAASQSYKKDVIVAHADEAVDDNVLADALSYDLKLLQARDVAAAAPPWFHLAMQEALTPINERLDHLTALTTRSVKLSSISYNLQAGSGTIRPLEKVHFLDGTDPLAHDLPALLNKAAVNNLTAQQYRDYYRGYYGPEGNLPVTARHKKLILQAIGCK